MPAVQVVEGLAAFTQALRSHTATAASIRAMLDAEGVELVSKLRTRCPVDSGALRDSIRYEVIAEASGLKLVIHVGDADTFYVRYIEYGSAHEPAQPFIRPVISGSRAGVLAELEAIVVKVGA